MLRLNGTSDDEHIAGVSAVSILPPIAFFVDPWAHGTVDAAISACRYIPKEISLAGTAEMGRKLWKGERRKGRASSLDGHDDMR